MQSTLLKDAQQFNLTLTEAQLGAFQIYSRELITWNQRVNLTRIIEPDEIVTRHFLDSLSVCQALSNLSAPFSLIDIGTGAGFPGLPLKIALPQIQLTLLESTAKKTAFLQYLVEQLQLKEVTILTARAEEAGQQTAHRQQYDVAVARAVANLSTLAEYTLPFVKVGGLVVAQKGQHPISEIEVATQALQQLGGEIKQVLPVQIPRLEEQRHLIVIKKINPTPTVYPRRSGVPGKKPL